MVFLTDFSKVVAILIISYTNALPAATTQSSSEHTLQTFWIQQMLILRHDIKECGNLSTSSFSCVWQCLKTTSLNLVDDLTRRQNISLWPGVRFVEISDTRDYQESLKVNPDDVWQRKDLQYLTWFDRLALSFNALLNTHILQINLKELSAAYINNTRDMYPSLSNSTYSVGTARHRRHRFNMMVTMMFGVIALGAVLIPMGFQMLSIVSGKALLLAKMALLLASINGLKRVANSGVHYGLYHVPGEQYGHYYDRGDVHHPRNVQNLAPMGQPQDVGLTV